MKPLAFLFVAAGLLLGQEPSQITPPATPGAPTPPPAVVPEQSAPAPDGTAPAKPATGKSKPRKHRSTAPNSPPPNTAKQPPQPT